MKLFWSLALLSAAAMAAVNPQLKQVSTVYILSMNGGMDQYLANRLTEQGVFQVVTDPQKADAIITDRLGEPFEAKLKELYPPPPPPPPPAPAPAAKDDKDSLKNDKDKELTAPVFKEKDKDSETPATQRMGTFSRGRGNIFIVDRKSRNVIWSTYERPKDLTPAELSKRAERVVKQLKTDLSGKKQSGGD